MEPIPPTTIGTLSTAIIARQTQKCLDELKDLALENPISPPKVLVSIGRPGTGKSPHVEDVSGFQGCSQQALDPVTQKCELAKVRIEDETCFIMDTPGFDPAHAEATFREIVRGIQTILSTSRIAGFLYFTCINQPRFGSFDRKVLQVVRAMSGYDYIPCVTFITTFWIADKPSQQAFFNNQLEFLKNKWKEAFGVQELHFYQHG
ncbi:hypothetical protein BBP40_011378 [Aspergillus hancockii]|nr:hypothetical protein BBP40_011378 [Aspergillus hancockii]